MNGDLTDFGGGRTVPAPRVRRKLCKQSPHNGKLCGFVGVETRRGLPVYATWCRSYQFYRDGNGYGLSVSILDSLAERHNAKRVIVEEKDDAGDGVYEFSVRQYLNADSVPTDWLVDENDPQVYVPVDEAMNHWPGHAGDLYARSFDAAMDAIGWRGYDPDLKERLADG